MKTTDFFVEKANEYIKTIEEIIKNLLPEIPLGFDHFNPPIEYVEQSEKISDIKLKTKLLFSEFDNGELFNNQINTIDKNQILNIFKEKVLENYKHVLLLFIEHLKIFRD